MNRVVLASALGWTGSLPDPRANCPHYTEQGDPFNRENARLAKNARRYKEGRAIRRQLDGRTIATALGSRRPSTDPGVEHGQATEAGLRATRHRRRVVVLIEIRWPSGRPTCAAGRSLRFGEWWGMSACCGSRGRRRNPRQRKYNLEDAWRLRPSIECPQGRHALRMSMGTCNGGGRIRIVAGFAPELYATGPRLRGGHPGFLRWSSRRRACGRSGLRHAFAASWPSRIVIGKSASADGVSFDRRRACGTSVVSLCSTQTIPVAGSVSNSILHKSLRPRPSRLRRALRFGARTQRTCSLNVTTLRFDPLLITLSRKCRALALARLGLHPRPLGSAHESRLAAGHPRDRRLADSPVMDCGWSSADRPWQSRPRVAPMVRPVDSLMDNRQPASVT